MDGLISSREAAKLCSLSKAAWYRLISRGAIGPRPIRLGGAVRWRKVELMDWIASGCPDRAAWQAMQQNAKGGR